MDSSDIPRKKIAVIGGGLVRLYLDTLSLLVVIILLLVLIIIVSRLHWLSIFLWNFSDT